MSMIKEAQTIAQLGDKVDFYKNAQQALGVASLTEAVRILKEDEDFGIQPQQIRDQVCDHLATQAGINPHQMTGRQFTQLAQQFRIELEDHYDEVYGNGEWRKLVDQAWQIHNAPQSRGMPEENEEFGTDQRTPVVRSLNRAPQQLSPAALLAKCARVVKSVQSREQYETAKKYANFVFQKLNDQIHNSKGMAGIQDSVSLINAIKSDLHAAFNRVTRGEAQENEEQGWPSDEAPEDSMDQARMRGDMSGEEFDDFNADANQPWDDEDLSMPPEQGAIAGEMGADEWDDLHREMNSGEEDLPPFQENEERSFDRAEARAINRGNPSSGRRDLGSADQSDEDRFNGALRAVDHLWGRKQRATPAQENEESNMSQEQRGWDDAKAGSAPRYPNDTEYMAGFERGTKLVGSKGGEENEEGTVKSKGSLLKSLLSQRKEVSQKASEISKKYETEGAAAFHEIRMKHEKSPYCPQKQAEEHSSWSKGWKKAAAEHYMPDEEEVKAKSKAKAKTKAKPKR